MKKNEIYTQLIDYFLKHQPQAKTELEYNSPYELLVAVCLSAQCTDKRVNIVTPSFFKKFPNTKKLKLATFEEVFESIKSISYPNNKSKNLLKAAEIIETKYKGKIPSNFEDLIQIPGVGRKTANVILSVLYDIPAMAVDTHVFRVSNRLGLVKNAKTPQEVERQLTENIPQKYINKAHHWLILHGRYTCKARTPDCLNCPFITFCPYYETTAKKSLRLLDTNKHHLGEQRRKPKKN